MKKVYVLVMVAIMTLGMSFKAQAIENPWNKGTLVANAHVGYYPGFGGNVAVDYVLVNNWWKGHFTVGGYVGFNGRSYDLYGGSTRYSYFNVMPRASYGLNITKDFEVHAGVMMGVCIDHTKTTTVLPYVGSSVSEDWYTHCVYAPLFGGCRYFFTPNFGVSAEICYSNFATYFNAGLTFKF